jgi:hypothetical protein
MRELVLLEVLRAGLLPGGEGAFVEVDTNEGRRQFKLTYADAERLIAVLQLALRQHADPKIPAKWETAIDPVNQVAVLRARAGDELQEARIARPQIAVIAEFLKDALKRFEAGAEMRQ